MDDKLRSNEIDSNNMENPQKPTRKRRTPSGEPNDRRRRSISRSVSRSPSRERGRRRRSRSRSPDRRFGRFGNRGGFQRGDYRRNRRSPSRSPDRYRRNNRNVRRSRSTSYDRYQNRRISRERSMSAPRGDSRPPYEYGQPPPPPPPPAGPYSQEYQQPGYPNQQPYPNYDYQVPMIQPVPNNYPQPQFSAPPPPVIGDYQQNLWNQVPPPPVISTVNEPKPNNIEEEKKREAIALEKKNQRDTILKQRDDYIRRTNALKKELNILREQRGELFSGNGPPSPTTNGFLKQNDRLQAEIEKKINQIGEVIDMLNKIIDGDKTASGSPDKKMKESKSDDSSPERLKSKVIESLAKKRKDSERVSTRDEEKLIKPSIKVEERVNYTFFDPEQHWCKACSTFPKTAKEYLGHLHSEEHKNNVKPPEIPWHDHLINDDWPTHPNVPTKRTPIRGLQFFIPSTAWYCKLCSHWIGDLHCASTHLKSQTHAREYEKFIQKNPTYETDWQKERSRALESHRERDSVPPPPPPIISSKPQNQAVVPTSYENATNRVFDSIPLQINPRAKEMPAPAPVQVAIPVPVTEAAEKKKGKKKKKEKKKRKKSKKKHRRSSSSSSSSSSEDSSESEDESTERKGPVEPPAPTPALAPIPPQIDTSTSIRVAMRNAISSKNHLKPKSDDEVEASGGWTVVQEAKLVAPQPPTISANGEAQNRRDEMLINQWSAPVPVISDKEKQLLEQLKGKLKSRDEPKREKSPPPKPVAVEKSPLPPGKSSIEEIKRGDDKRKDDRRDAYRRRRSRSPSSPRRDRRSRSRSPRRDRRRRTRSISPRRDSRRSRSPRRDRRKRSRTRSKSPDRRGKQDSKFIPPNRRDKDEKSDRKKSENDKSTKKSTTAAATTKRLPFIGRMPVLKKQTSDEDTKKAEALANQISEEEKLMQKKKEEEAKFVLNQTKQLLHQHQKQAEAYNLAHPGQFANIYNSHGSIHHILPPVQEEYDDLMPDPMQYVSLMAPPPPPSAEAEQLQQQLPHSIPHPHQLQDQQEQHRYEVAEEPVLPPGIDEDEVENMEPVVPDVPAKDVLPKDFQDALSIIFDRGAEKQNDETATASADGTSKTLTESGELPQSAMLHDENSTYTSMDIALESHEQIGMDTHMELDEQAQYHMIYAGTENTIYGDLTTHIPQAVPPPNAVHLDAAGNYAQIPGSVLETGGKYADGIAYAINNDTNANNGTINQITNDEEIILRNKRMQELDDLAMLGIDAEDLAAQCI